jgi:hypothetical protein
MSESGLKLNALILRQPNVSFKKTKLSAVAGDPHLRSVTVTSKLRWAAVDGTRLVVGIYTSSSLRLRDLQVLPDKNCPELPTTPLTRGNLKERNNNFFFDSRSLCC